MKCEHIHDKLSEYLEGLLDHENYAAVQSHLSSCSRCQVEAQALERGIRAVAELPSVEPPPGFSQKVMARIRGGGRKAAPLAASLPADAGQDPDPCDGVASGRWLCGLSVSGQSAYGFDGTKKDARVPACPIGIHSPAGTSIGNRRKAEGNGCNQTFSLGRCRRVETGRECPARTGQTQNVGSKIGQSRCSPCAGLRIDPDLSKNLLKTQTGWRRGLRVWLKNQEVNFSHPGREPTT